jgi:hypothetical protein
MNIHMNELHVVGDTFAHYFKDSNANLKMKIVKEIFFGVCSLACNTSKVQRCAGAQGLRLE